MDKGDLMCKLQFVEGDVVVTTKAVKNSWDDRYYYPKGTLGTIYSLGERFVDDSDRTKPCVQIEWSSFDYCIVDNPSDLGLVLNWELVLE